jgi:hypothetical protein
MKAMQHLVVDVLIGEDVSREEVIEAVTERVLAMYDSNVDAEAAFPVPANMLDFGWDFSKRPV